MKLHADQISCRNQFRQLLFTDLSLTLESGQCLAVCGNDAFSGTMLLKMLGGLETPHRGQVRLDDIDLYEADEVTQHRLQSQIGFLFSGTGLISNLSIEENLMLPVRFHHAVTEYPKFHRQIDEWLQTFDLGNILSLRPAQLSPARSKMAALIRMLLLDPEVILLDNPYFNLDIFCQQMFLRFLRQYSRQNKIIVMATDSPDLVNEFADEVLVLHTDASQETIPRADFERLSAYFAGGNWERRP